MDNTDTPWLSREDASLWFQGKGITHITVSNLKKLAHQGKGPEFSKMGKLTYYKTEDLLAWLNSELKPATQGRGELRV